LLELVRNEALAARTALGQLAPATVDAALERVVQGLAERRADLLRANAGDLAAAKERLDAGALDRLRLDAARFDAMAEGVRATSASSRTSSSTGRVATPELLAPLIAVL